MILKLPIHRIRTTSDNRVPDVIYSELQLMIEGCVHLPTGALHAALQSEVSRRMKSWIYLSTIYSYRIHILTLLK